MKETKLPELYAKYEFWKIVNECEAGMWVAFIFLSLSCGWYAWYKIEHWIAGAAVGSAVFATLALTLVLAGLDVRWKRDNAHRAYLRAKHGGSDTW